MGHDGFLHVSLSRLVYRRLRPAHRDPGKSFSFFQHNYLPKQFCRKQTTEFRHQQDADTDWPLTHVQGGSLCFSKLDFAVAWFIRESMAVQIFLSALWDPTISWRTGRYRLRCGGTAEEILDV